MVPYYSIDSRAPPGVLFFSNFFCLYEFGPFPSSFRDWPVFDGLSGASKRLIFKLFGSFPNSSLLFK